VKYKLSRRARQEMERRGISLDLLEQLLQTPQQIVAETRGRKAYQSTIDFGSGKKFLVRAIVADEHDPPVVMTVYRTSKVHKYWRLP
jgi:hypothetical protein